MLNSRIIASSLLLSIATTACVVQPLEGQNGEQHHIIIGFGVVTTPGKNRASKIEAMRSHIVGVDLSVGERNGIRAGYAFEASARIPDNTENFCAEIAGKPFGTLLITSCDGQPALKQKENVENQE